MALLTALPLTDAQRLCREFGLEVTAIEPLSAGSVNSNFALTGADGRRYFARLYEEQGREGALAELKLVGALAKAGVPVVQCLPRADGAGVGDFGGKSFAIFPWLDGEILCQGRVSVDACQKLGAALARVHLTTPLVARPPEGRFRIVDLRERLLRVEASGRAEFSADVARIREAFARYEAARATQDAPRGVIHSDLFRDNVLWTKQGELAALLDFESACEGAFAYDVMVTICAWCYSAKFETQLVEAFLRGYHAVRPIVGAEVAALKVEGAVGCLRFATTRITDFSLRAAPGQAPVRDYRRFLARLSSIEAGDLDGCFQRALA
ncbi:MAG TPA: homoserine kinase [Polyangiaceae bacterium]|nr:homoserine kinase [Polyangiaceae bacterium]